MSAAADHLGASWDAFMRQWEALRPEWNDAVSEEVARRWIDNWAGPLRQYEADLREVEAFLQEVGI